MKPIGSLRLLVVALFAIGGLVIVWWAWGIDAPGAWVPDLAVGWRSWPLGS